jgi:hypothetical protein
MEKNIILLHDYKQIKATDRRPNQNRPFHFDGLHFTLKYPCRPGPSAAEGNRGPAADHPGPWLPGSKTGLETEERLKKLGVDFHDVSKAMHV